MIKWGKRFPVLVALAAVLTLSAMTLSGVLTPQEYDKAQRAQDLLAQRPTTTASQELDPEVAAKYALEAETAAKIAAELTVGLDKGEDPVHPVKPIISNTKSGLPTANSITRAAANYEPRAIYLSEDFEGEIFPPTDWDTVNFNPGWGWFLGTYQDGGTQCALVTWDQDVPATLQDEWLITPELDVSGATSLLRMEFDMLQGYTYPHDFKIYVSYDGTTFTEIWDSYGTGYPEHVWYGASVDLSAYAGGANIWLAFQYTGTDADLFGIDNVVVTDDAEAVGRCCSGDPLDPTCEDLTQAECAAGGGTWTAGLNCNDNPCPVAGPDDICSEVTPQALPYTFTGNNEAATFDTECQYFTDNANSWIAFTIDECTNIEISYCGSPEGWGNGWLNLITDCSCAEGTLIADATYAFDCANGNPRVFFARLPAGTYYYPIMLDPGAGAVGDWVVEVTGEACPPAQPGDDCENPFVVELSSSALPYTVANQYTCGRQDIYNATCLGSYDGGEDLIVRLDVTDAMFVDITLDPKGTTWSGFSISNACPDDGGTCIGFIATSSGDPKKLANVELVPGTYYIMVDTYPSPDCIPDLDLIFEAAQGPQEGDNCENPIKVDIPTLPWSDLGQTTCDRGNSYEDPNDDVCMGYYTNGEDIFYKITVLSPVTVNFHLDPKGTSYSGMGLFESCPPTLDNCIDFETGSSSSPKSMTCVTLDPGEYFLMIDTWSTPYCIPEFDLTIVDTTCEDIGGNDCADATETGEVTGLAFTTDGAQFDGPGGCQTAPNVWFAYTAGADGTAIIDLCGSGYDTKMAVYTGTCEALVEVGCNDDYCSLQSGVELPGVKAGDQFLIEVGGFSSNTGAGVLNIEVVPDCEFACPTGATPEGESCITDEGDDVTNGGCNSEPPAFGAIGCGETICGEWSTYLFGTSNYRDTDWYQFELDDWYEVTLDAEGSFPIIFGFLEQIAPGVAGCENLTGNIAPYVTADECTAASVSTLLGPGTYYVFVGGTVYTGFDCSTGPWEYAVSMTCDLAGPEYCEAGGGCDEYIENVTVGDINNTTACDNYGDYTAIATAVEPGGSYPITVTIGNSYSSDQGGIWVDWNQDYAFDASEQVTLDVSTGAGPYTGTIVVPADAAPGSARMRVRLVYSATPAPCGVTSYGEVEDYTLTVGEPVPAYMLYPDPIFALMKFAINPMIASVYMSDEAMEGGSVVDMTNIAMNVGAVALTVESTEILPDGWSVMPGPVMKVSFSVKDYILAEEVRQGGLLWDHIDSFFDVTYELSGVPGTFNGEVEVIGHRSGDLNLDDAVNVADVTFMVAYLFMNGDAPPTPELGNVDGSANLEPNVSDLTYLVQYLFNGGNPPTHQ